MKEKITKNLHFMFNLKFSKYLTFLHQKYPILPRRKMYYFILIYFNYQYILVKNRSSLKK